MKVLVFTIAALLFSGLAFAEQVTLNVTSLRSGRVNGVRRVTIAPTKDGQLDVYVDPNVCGNPGPCTKRAVRHHVVTPKVVSDMRSRDGALRLQLTDDMQLIVGSGYNADQHVTYTAVITNALGKESSFALSPEVYLDVVK
jgi:hypothetical protein